MSAHDTPSHRDEIRRQIDENLRRVYKAALDEEIPERFRVLLASLQGRPPHQQDVP